MKMLARSHKLPNWFCTLTYPSEFPTCHEAKQDVRRFLQNVHRWHTNNDKHCFIIWRMEKQKRGAPHFHLLIWSDWEKPLKGSKALRQVRWRDAIGNFKDGAWYWNYDKAVNTTDWEQWLCWLSCSWWMTTNTNNLAHLRCGVDLRGIENPRQVTTYVSKYVAKVEEGGEGGEEVTAKDVTGRIWGKVGSADWVGFEPIGTMSNVVPALAKYFDQGIADAVGSDYAMVTAGRGDLSFFLFTDEVIAQQIAMEFRDVKRVEDKEW